MTEKARPADRAERVSRAFLALLALCYALIVLGASVRAHGAGLACPDWPLCFGEFIPPLDFHVAFEYGHRVLAGSVSLLFLGLAIVVHRDPSLRVVCGRSVRLGALLLVVQIVLGGLTVLHLLASWTVTAHLVTGNAFALTLLASAVSLREHAQSRRPRPAEVPPRLRWLLAGSASLLALQIVVGGLVSSRYAGLACPDWPTCDGPVWVPTLEGAVGLQVLHRIVAYALATALVATALAARGIDGLERPVRAAVAIVVLQIVVGATNVWLRLPVEVTALHTALAAGLVLLVGFCVRAAFRASLPDAVPAPSREALRAGG